jgi:hypothetical protein
MLADQAEESGDTHNFIAITLEKGDGMEKGDGGIIYCTIHLYLSSSAVAPGTSDQALIHTSIQSVL